MRLIPKPKKLELRNGECQLGDLHCVTLSPDCSDTELNATRSLCADMQQRFFIRPELRRGGANEEHVIRLEKSADGDGQAYSIEVSSDRITVRGDGGPGLFYGIQTLRQMVDTADGAIPRLHIEDSPDFRHRGFYHDVTRGKVPKLETLLELAEKMAYYKLNQLQLYVEHTFAFRNHPDIWAGADPLTAEDILVLDERCRRLHIELVPSLSSFGHLYTLLRGKRKEHLNELEVKASEKPFSFWDRQRHYTLDCLNPESAELIDELIGEFAPLFSSKYFNICCDETRDLGRGRNAAKMEELDEGELYLSFLKKIMASVRKHDRIPMFWGDIVLHFPERIKEVPSDAVVLHWKYLPDPPEEMCRCFQESGLEFYVCSGVHGWNSFLNGFQTACENISKLTEQGRRRGAIGVLNTDWGDHGHVNLLGNSFHGMLFGAATAWNLDAETDAGDFDARFSLLEMGDPSERIGALLRTTKSSSFNVSWAFFTQWLEVTGECLISADMRDPVTGFNTKVLNQSADDYLADYRKLLDFRSEVAELARRAKPKDALVYRELACGARGAAWSRAAVLLLQKASGREVPESSLSFYGVADEIRRFELELSELWQRRNRPSEYHRVKTTLLAIAERLDEYGREGSTA